MEKKRAYLSEALVERVYARARARFAKPREVERAARREMHRVSGAFFTREDARRAGKLLETWPDGGDEALARILWLHASTRERLPLSQTDALFARIFAQTGRPERVLDIACGLNPIYLGARSLAVTGVDAHLDAVALVNRFGRENGLEVRAEVCDVLDDPLPPGRFRLALAFKLLPLLGADGARLLARLEADFVAVSFPTRTLGGRSVGMERNYAQAFEAQIPPRYAVCERFVAGGELIYLLKER